MIPPESAIKRALLSNGLASDFEADAPQAATTSTECSVCGETEDDGERCSDCPRRVPRWYVESATGTPLEPMDVSISDEICRCPCCMRGIPAPHEYHLERRPMYQLRGRDVVTDSGLNAGTAEGTPASPEPNEQEGAA